MSADWKERGKANREDNGENGRGGFNMCNVDIHATLTELKTHLHYIMQWPHSHIPVSLFFTVRTISATDKTKGFCWND